MDRRHRITLALAFAGGVLAVGASYWRIPYAALSLPDAILGFGLVVVCVLAVLSRMLSGTRFWPTTWIVGASVPAAVMARVAFDVLRDSTSHNLWPLELVLAAGPGFAAAGFGAILGGLLSRRRRA